MMPGYIYAVDHTDKFALLRCSLRRLPGLPRRDGRSSFSKKQEVRHQKISRVSQVSWEMNHGCASSVFLCNSNLYYRY